MQGLTLDEVATRLNGVVTKQAISKYERGLMSPSPPVLAALQKLYGISSTELSLPVHIITNWNFRRGRLLSAKTEAAIQSEINDLENGKFKYYVPPIYINKIKTWIKR